MVEEYFEEEQIEEYDIYSEEGITQLEDEEAINPDEAGFMRGALNEEE